MGVVPADRAQERDGRPGQESRLRARLARTPQEQNHRQEVKKEEACGE
jgi:hypothetical protein